MEEQWKTIRFAPSYQVSDLGRVRREKILKPFVDARGYPTVKLCQRGKATSVKVHHLVLKTFVSDKPIGLECRHLNGIKTDNRLVNLVWGTHKENYQDLVLHGKDFLRKGGIRGEASPQRKFTIDECIQIASEYVPRKVSIPKLAQKYGVSNATMQKIIERRYPSKNFSFQY